MFLPLLRRQIESFQPITLSLPSPSGLLCVSHSLNHSRFAAEDRADRAGLFSDWHLLVDGVQNICHFLTFAYFIYYVGDAKGNLNMQNEQKQEEEEVVNTY